MAATPNADPILFSDLRDREEAERSKLLNRKITLESIKRELIKAERSELDEIIRKLATDAVADPLFQAVRAAVAEDVEDHKGGLLPTQQGVDISRQVPGDTTLKRAELLVKQKANLVNFSKVNRLIKAVVTILEQPTPRPANDPLFETANKFAEYQSAILRPGSDPDVEKQKLLTALDQPGFEILLKAAVDEDLISEAKTLVDWLLVLPSTTSGLTSAEIKLCAVYGLIEADRLTPPPFRLIDPTNSAAILEAARKNPFTADIFTRLGEFSACSELFEAVLPILVEIGSRTPTDTVSAEEWALVVRNLVKRGITENEPQLVRRVNEALDAIQAIGDELPPSLIGIDLPDIDGPTTILKDNILALQPAYFASMFEEMKAFAVVDRLVELFQNGVLPVGRGNAGNSLFKYWKDTAVRVSESERRNFYARALGAVGGDDGGLPNREFNDLFLRFVSSVSSFLRQNNVDELLRTKLPGSISQQQVRKSGRDLAANLSLHGYGMAYFMATELQKQVKDVIAILSDVEIMSAYGARDMWQVIDQVAATDLGGARNSIRYRTMAASGAIVIAWLANHAVQLSSGSFDSILDIDEIRNPPVRKPGNKPTTNPTDSDLVNACEQWLAVTGTQDDMVEDYSQRRESPNMPSKPIQIPAIAREMLDSAGISSPMGVNGNGRYAYR